MLRLPNVSIAAKYYSIFAPLAVVRLVGAVASNIKAKKSAVATRAAEHIERVDALVYAVVMQSRGIYMSSDLLTP